MSIESQEELERIVVTILKDVAGELLANGRAKLASSSMGDCPLILLDPANPAAAPLRVAIEFPDQVTCFPGRNWMPYEVFQKDEGKMRDDVRGLAEAVVRGDYSEVVNDTGERTKIVASWSEGRRQVSPHYNVLRTPRPGAKGWRTARYEAY